jgi:hypothetical protein
VAGRLIVEHLDGETLVYDTELNEVHALAGSGAADFAAAADDVSRREVLRKLALAGVAAAGAGALVKSIVAPTAAQAQSACVPGGGVCTTVAECCALSNATVACTNNVCSIATCNAGFADCDTVATTGCETNLLTDTQNCGTCNNVCAACCDGGTCRADAAPCTTAGGTCCRNTCCDTAAGFTCVGGVLCTFSSDRNLKHHLACVEPGDMLAVVG